MAETLGTVVLVVHSKGLDFVAELLSEVAAAAVHLLPRCGATVAVLTTKVAKAPDSE